MSKRKEGWYWVKPDEHRKWRPDFWRDGKWRAIWSTPEEDPIHHAIGPRILTPDEMEGWQVVPKEDTTEITTASIDFSNGKRYYESRWQQMLAAAPKPEA